MRLTKKHYTRKQIVTAVLKLTIAILGAFIMAFPFYWMILTSIKSQGAVVSYPPTFFTSEFCFDNFTRVWDMLPFGRAYINTLLVSLSVVVFSLLTTSMSAYAFGKLKFPGKKALFSMFLATMMIPSQVTLVPLYLILRKLGLYNNLLALIIPAALFNAYGVFMLRQFVMGIPNDIQEAAIIDGAGYFRIYSQIFLPLISTALVSSGIFIFLNAYNDFLMPMIMMKDATNFTVPILLAQLKGQFKTDIQLANAASTIAVIPVIIVYCFAQRYIIEGIAITGMKA